MKGWKTSETPHCEIEKVTSSDNAIYIHLTKRGARFSLWLDQKMKEEQDRLERHYRRHKNEYGIPIKWLLWDPYFH